MHDIAAEERRLYASVDTGFIGQNVYLFCASEGLATVFRGAVDNREMTLSGLPALTRQQVEYQVRDRLSFSRFLRLAIEDSIPDATTLWLFREKLAKAGLIEKLFDRFDQHLAAKGYMARGGQIIDASIVPVPTQRNSHDENDELQAGRTPTGWKRSPPCGRRTAMRAGPRSMAAASSATRTCERGRQAQADPVLCCRATIKMRGQRQSG
jgi:hypothetical protein